MSTIRIVSLFALFSVCACAMGDVYVPSSNTQNQNTVSPPPGSTPTTVDPNAATANFPATGPTVRYVGRFDASNPNGMQFAWSRSTVITNFHGTGISAGLIEEENATYLGKAVGNFYDVYIDNNPPTTIQANHNSSQYVLASGLSADTNHTVKLVRRTEAQMGAAMFTGFTVTDGALMPAPPASGRSIEFIGDSITCGYGVLASEFPPNSCTFSDSTESGDASFAALTAATLGADFTEIAFSGKGMMVNVDPADDPNNTLPVLYPYAVPQWFTPYDFNTTTWNPQVVVINLGTNDYKSGRTINPSAFVQTYENFIRNQVRKVYPNAQIFCLVGPVLQGASLTAAETNIKQVVSDFNNGGDAKVHYLEFPFDNGANGYGCDDHPDQVTQANMAAQLAPAIKQAMGW